MAEEDLETFVVHSSERSIASTPEHEGTNASRFAIVGALAAPVPFSFDDSLSIVRPETLERFGFNTSLARSQSSWNQSRDGLYGEAAAFIERTEGWLSGEGRFQAWAEVAAGDLRSRLMLLAEGVRSDLERESAAAAVALVGLLRGNGDLTRFPGSLWDSRHLWWWRWNRDWPDAWGDELWLSPPDEPVSEHGVSAATWDGARWREFSTQWIAEWLTEGDAQLLLGAVLRIATVRAREAGRSSDSVVREFASTLRWLGAPTALSTPAPHQMHRLQPPTRRRQRWFMGRGHGRATSTRT